MDFEREKAECRSCKRRWILLLLALSLLMNLLFVDWGMPNHYSWAADHVHPYFVLHGMERYFSQGWFQKYPPFHYMLTAAAYLPVMAFCDSERTGALFQDARKICESKVNPNVDFLAPNPYKDLVSLLFVTGRVLNAVMGAFISLALFLLAREFFGAKAGWAAAFIAAFHPMTIFYAHTMNTEAPYFMWAAFGLYFYARALARQDLSAYLGLGLCAALGASTKEQAMGLFFFLPPLILYVRAKHIGEGRFRWRSAARALVDKHVLAGAGMFILAFALANNLIFNSAGYLTHLKFNRPGVSVLERIYPLTFAGCAELTWESVKWLYQTASPPVLAICLIGLALALWKDGKKALALALPAVSYFVTFIVYIGFVTPRYMTPVFYVLAVFGGKALAGFWEWRKIPKTLRAALLSAACLYVFILGLGMVGLLKDDPRYGAEEWLEANVPEGAKVQAVVRPQNALCRLPPDRIYPPIMVFEQLATSRKRLRKQRPDFLVIHVFGECVFKTPAARWLGRLGPNIESLGYETVKVFEPKWPHPALYYLFVNPHVIVAKRK